MATPRTLYWLKQTAGKSTLPRHAAILPVLQCSISLFISFIAQGWQLPPQYLCGFCLPLDSFSVLVPGSFPGNIDAWQNAMLPLRLPMKRPREKCVGSSAAISNDSALIFSVASNSPRCRRRKFCERVKVDNIEAMDREFRAGVPVVLVLSHLGIWELFAQLMPKFVGYVRNASVYQKLGNRFIDAHVRRTRGQTGLELFDRQQGFQPVIDLLRSGGGVGVLSDQHAGDHGLWTPFFGRLASTSPLPALLAKRTRAALIAAGVYTMGPARWRMVFTERFDPPKADASIAALTSEINQIIEQQIRVAPEDWFWVHNRWKTPSPIFFSRNINVASICHREFHLKI